MEKIATKTPNISAVVPAELHVRLMRQAGKESVDRGRTITPSAIIRYALEDYLDQWETATFVPDTAQPKET